LFGDRPHWILFVQMEPATGAVACERLALQYGFRHYCGSDDIRADEARAVHQLNQ
jgi:hypothetical protein